MKKLRKLLIGLAGLSLSVGAAIGVGLNADKGAKEAKAANNKTFYLDCTDFSGFDDTDGIVFRTWSTSRKEQGCYGATKAGDNYWSVSLDVSIWDGGQFYRCQSDNPYNYYEDNKQSWLSFPSDNFYYQVKGWQQTTDNVQWSAPVSWSLTGSSSAALTSFRFDGDGYQYYAKSVTLATNDVIQFTNGTLTTGYTDLRDVGNGQTAKEKGLVENDGHDKVKIVRGGAFDIYVNCVTGKVWMQQDANSEATHWAEDFIKNDCAAASTGTKAKWGDHNTAYDALTAGAKEALSTQAHIDHLVDKSGDSAIVQAVQRYDYVLERYGRNDANNDTYGYKDFMGRADSGKVTPKHTTVDAPKTNVDSNNNSLIVIIAASVVSLLAVGGYFFYRKRKEDR